MENKNKEKERKVDHEIHLTLLVVLFCATFWVFYLLRMDETPGMTMFKALAILLLVRFLDFSTFLWIAKGKELSQELNPIYQIFVESFSHDAAALLSFEFMIVIMSLAILFLWYGGGRRITFACICTFTAFGIVGAISNLIGGI